MKKILSLFVIVMSLLSTYIRGDSEEERDTCFDGSFTAGYVFKHDHDFKRVYGRGMINAITADGCYYPWQMWGLGAKISYWRARGHTTFLCQCSLVQEIPVTVYVRWLKDFDCGLQTYLSLGGGFAWIKEKSYLGHVKTYKGIGELEVGAEYAMCYGLNIVGAFRYIFPPQSFRCDKIDVGGCDLRAGIGYSF